MIPSSSVELIATIEELEKGWYVPDPDTGAMPDSIVSAGADAWINKAIATMKEARLVLTKSTESEHWIEWQGGECPLPEGTRISFQQRDGVIRQNVAGNLDWSHNGPEVVDGDSDIMRYRIIKTEQSTTPDPYVQQAVALCKRMEMSAETLSTNPDEQRGIRSAAWNLGIAIQSIDERLKGERNVTIAGEHTTILETARYILKTVAANHREDDPHYSSACSKAADGCRAAAIALEAVRPDTDARMTERYPLEAEIWKRSPYGGCPDGEWVLEITGSINDTYFICRHTEPLTVAPENVAGLPSLYNTVYVAEPARRIIEKIADAVGTMQREGTDDFHKGCEAIQRECLPLFEELGMVETSEGLGFDEDHYGGFK